MKDEAGNVPTIMVKGVHNGAMGIMMPVIITNEESRETKPPRPSERFGPRNHPPSPPPKAAPAPPPAAQEPPTATPTGKGNAPKPKTKSAKKKPEAGPVSRANGHDRSEQHVS
jgi:hypothetical protein